MLQRFLGLSEEESRSMLSILESPTPNEWTVPRPIRGGRTVRTVPGQRFIQRYNEAFGLLWSFEVPSYFERDGQIVVQGRWSLNIPGRKVTRRYPDGTEETVEFEGIRICKEQFGSSEVDRWGSDEVQTDKRGSRVLDKDGKPVYKHRAGDPIDLGDDFKSAATDAMKKAGTQLGVFLDIYGPQDAAAEEKPSDVQLQAFYGRAIKAGMQEADANAWAEKQLGKPIGKANKQELLGLTADLIQMGKEKAEK
jgi:hypothetical protein